MNLGSLEGRWPTYLHVVGFLAAQISRIKDVVAKVGSVKTVYGEMRKVLSKYIYSTYYPSKKKKNE